MPFCCISLKIPFLLFWFVSFRFNSFIHKFLSFISFHFISFPFMPFHLISFIHLMSFHFMSFPILSYCFTYSFHSIPFHSLGSIPFDSIRFDLNPFYPIHFISFHFISCHFNHSVTHSVVDSLKKMWFIDWIFDSFTSSLIHWPTLPFTDSKKNLLIRSEPLSHRLIDCFVGCIALSSDQWSCHVSFQWHPNICSFVDTQSFPDPSQKSTPLYRLLISALLGTGRHYLVTLWYFQIQQSVAISNRFGRAVLKMLCFSSTSHAPQQLATIRSLAVGIRGWLSHLTREWHCLGSGSFTKKDPSCSWTSCGRGTVHTYIHIYIYIHI